MKVNVLQLTILATTVLASAHSMAKKPFVIYGEDGRQEVYEASPENQARARSTAVMVPAHYFYQDSKVKGQFHLSQHTLNDVVQDIGPDLMIRTFEREMEARGMQRPIVRFAPPVLPNIILPTINLPNLTLQNPEVEPSKSSLMKILSSVPEKSNISFCADEKFVDQPIPAGCSGFLIAPDLLVTAGHCLNIKNMCNTHAWVFDFKVDKLTKEAGISQPKSNIYFCKAFVSLDMNAERLTDYGIIMLDRDVVGRKPFKFRTEGKVPDDADLVVIGSPSGLPTKVTVGGKVRTNDEKQPFFTANTDTYHGNSGSVVLDEKTGLVEGILTRGDDDFLYNFRRFCIGSNKCKEDGCRGEDVSRITSIPEIGVYAALRKASVSGDLNAAFEIIKLGIWPDFYGAEKVTALMEALGAGQTQVANLLLNVMANPKLVDIKKNSTIHYAVKANTIKMHALIAALVKEGANINGVNNLGETPIFTAIANGNLELTKVLISLGAYVDFENAKGLSVLDLAKNSVNKDLVKLIRKARRIERKELKASMKKALKMLGTSNGTVEVENKEMYGPDEAPVPMETTPIVIIEPELVPVVRK